MLVSVPGIVAPRGDPNLGRFHLCRTLLSSPELLGIHSQNLSSTALIRQHISSDPNTPWLVTNYCYRSHRDEPNPCTRPAQTPKNHLRPTTLLHGRRACLKEDKVWLTLVEQSPPVDPHGDIYDPEGSPMDDTRMRLRSNSLTREAIGLDAPLSLVL